MGRVPVAMWMRYGWRLAWGIAKRADYLIQEKIE
jgi:hypothetical protein